MLPYIFAEKKGIHIIDLNKTTECLQETAAALKQIARSGKKILFVGTKKQAKDIVTECAQRVNMPYVTLSRDRDKMDKVLGGISQLGRVPAALFIVDIGHEHIALAEAKRLGVSTFGVVDTNCDPNKVDFAIPANDDATKSIAIITNYITAAIAEGLAERQAAKDEDGEDTSSSDDTEKRAARLEAEAQNEAGRGRGGRGRGGNAPGAGGQGGPGGAGGGQRRRTPPGGSRGPGGGRR